MDRILDMEPMAEAAREPRTAGSTFWLQGFILYTRHDAEVSSRRPPGICGVRHTVSFAPYTENLGISEDVRVPTIQMWVCSVIWGRF